LTFAPYLIYGKPGWTSHLVDTLVPIAFAVAGHAKYLVSPDTFEREKQRLPEMLDDIAEELKLMATTIPIIVITGCSWRSNLLAAPSTQAQTSERCDGGVLGTTLHLDVTIASSPLAYSIYTGFQLLMVGYANLRARSNAGVQRMKYLRLLLFLLLLSHRLSFWFDA
jgi:hypothetical protein